MECNKDEGLRARQIAGARTQRGEFVEALKFATKAKRLYADVENITLRFLQFVRFTMLRRKNSLMKETGMQFFRLKGWLMKQP